MGYKNASSHTSTPSFLKFRLMKYFKYIALTFWIIALSLFFREIYIYAFVHAMGIGPALKMFGEEMQAGLMGFGIFTPILFMLLYIVRPILLFPASIMTITSVFLFGPYLGFLVSYIGEVFSSIVAFFIGKYFAEELGLAEKVTHTKIGKYFQGNAFTSVFMLRLVPIFPFDFVNYASGVAELPFKSYIYGTMLGVLPGLSAYIFLGFSLMNTKYLVVAGLVFIVLFAVGHKGKKHLEKRRV